MIPYKVGRCTVLFRTDHRSESPDVFTTMPMTDARVVFPSHDTDLTRGNVRLLVRAMTADGECSAKPAGFVQGWGGRRVVQCDLNARGLFLAICFWWAMFLFDVTAAGSRAVDRFGL